MKRSNQIYLTATAMAASAWFLGAVILKGHESYSLKALAEQNAAVRVSVWYYIFAALFGLLFGLSAACLWYTRKHDVSVLDFLKAAKSRGRLILGSAAGLGIGILCSSVFIGLQPVSGSSGQEGWQKPIAYADKKENEKEQTAAEPAKEAEKETEAAKQETHEQPKQEEANTEKKEEQNAASAEDSAAAPVLSAAASGFPIPELPPVLDSDTISQQASGKAEVVEETTAPTFLSATEPDQSSLLVKDGGSATLLSAEIYKSGAGDGDQCLLYGINSAILVRQDSVLNMMASEIQASGESAAGISCTGNDAYARVSDSKITTLGSRSAGIQAMYHGTLSASGLQIYTSGELSPAMNVRTGSSLSLQTGLMQTKGAGSTLLQCAGTAQISNLNGNALNGNVGTFYEGASVEMRGNTMSASGYLPEDETGAMFLLTQDPNIVRARPVKLLLSSSSVAVNAGSAYAGAPLIKTAGTDFDVTLEQNSLKLSSGILLSQNGGKGTLTLSGQYAGGSVDLSDDGNLNLVLGSGSTLAGSVNSAGSKGTVRLKLDRTSKLVLTGDCYVDSLENEDELNSNINLNGFTLYVNGQPLAQ
ncbi:MAG: hypothetical protein HUJ54_00870 [Erysipelotrichaceae bacterium]|nr:hypothetical protein [Erysipelotrichaceae bacterium]